MTPEVLYLDNHVLVVVKPAGAPVQADRTGDPDVLTEAKRFVRARYGKPGEVYLGLVHRLDRPVSGVLALARTSKAAARLSEQFRTRTADKRYLAVAEGMTGAGGTLTDYLVKAYPEVARVPPGTPGAQRAVLHWRRLAAFGGLSLLDIRLETGRPHQVRVQLAGMGHPILGDFRYGARAPLDGRCLALHCYYLGLEHPTLRVRMGWSCPPPPTWEGRFAAETAALLGALPAAG